MARQILLWGCLLAAFPLPVSAAEPRVPPVAEIVDLLLDSWLFWARDADALAEQRTRLLAAGDAETLNFLLRRDDPYARWAPDQPPGAAGALAGIGAELSVRDGLAWLWPRQGGALAREGYVQPLGLLAVDGEAVANVEAKSLAARLRGVPGSAVELELLLPGARWGRYETQVIVREPNHPLDVEVWRAGQVALLRIFSFHPGRTRVAVRAAIEASLPEPTVWILDLRPASGGDLYEALDLAADLLPAGLGVGLLQSQTGAPRQITAAGQLQVLLGERPLVVWVGAETASAAEILTSALQFHQRAWVVGERTLGKCFSQAQRRLSVGSLLWTNLEFLLPDGRSCDPEGIIPDALLRDPRRGADPAMGSRHYPVARARQAIAPELQAALRARFGLTD